MFDEKKSTKNLMAFLTVCVTGAAILCFFLPMLTVNFFGSWSLNGFELMSELGSDAYPLIIALVCSAVGILFALLASKNKKLLAGNIACSATAMILMFILFGGQDLFAETGVGFYLFVAMHLAAIVMAVIALTGSSGSITEKIVPVKNMCPKCGKKVGKDQGFCDGCGANLRESVVVDIPSEYHCKNCGKVIDENAPFCRFCGASKNPVVTLSDDKPKRTAICPKCGAKQVEGTVICKYCGTKM